MKKISIGLPVYNEEKNIKKVLNNIISQNYRNKEVIISDNCSTDLTGLICRKFSNKFKFIKYYRQKKKLDLFKNFNFVASTGISKLDKKKFLNNKVSFAFDGSLHSRIWTFIFYKWLLKGILDSVIRIKIIRKFPYNNFPNYFARDWTVVLFLILSGKINRDIYSYAKIGSKGISFKNDAVIFQRYNKKDFIEKLFPFYYFTKHSLVLIKSQKFITKIYLLFFLIILNFFIYPRMFLKKIFKFF
jgi:glycosyltransferase involved in cell wall biosynthesis